MKKSAIKTYSILAILLLSLTSPMLLIAIEPVDGEIISMQWGHCLSGVDENEKDAQEDLCDDIYWMFDNDVMGTWSPVNAWWVYTNTTCLNMTMVYANNVSNGVTFVTNWWVGDFYPDSPPPYPFGHFCFYGHEGDHINDTYVDSKANYFLGSPVSSKQKFEFIWTCGNGGIFWYDDDGHFYDIAGITDYVEGEEEPQFEPDNNNTRYGFFYSGDVVGMPLAWTGTSSMNLDGYNSASGSYCYMGFEGPSPALLSDLPETNTAAYNFPYDFYWYALGYEHPEYYYCHESISESLDFASEWAFGDEFDETPFYEGYWKSVVREEETEWWFVHMRVLGNGNMVLPTS